MSFSSDVKKEIFAGISDDKSPHCSKARLCAIINVCGYVNTAEQNKFIVIHNENKDILNFAARLISDLSGTKAKLESNNLVINEADSVLRLSEMLGLKDSSDFSLTPVIMPDIVRKTCCKRAYIAAAFLTCGSVTDPNKDYHIEFACNDYDHASELKDLVSFFGIDMKIIERKNRYVLYCKEAEQIVDLINVMSAYRSLLDFENLRVVKNVRNNVNRVVNCETANINKVVSTAVRQLNDIQYIAEKKGLRFLPYNLRQVAEIRLEHPDASLKEIGELLTPPLGKSGVNHRFNKIHETAEKLKGVSF